ncbi:PIN domain-containing protein [Elizabethkingia meningoseptica]|uniref:PIN domain-containing protein n=1 Tax=Elizabethkingia meningoseptica TaxID=238 RepID=UPI003892592B
MVDSNKKAIDTNILIYAYQDGDLLIKKRAIEILNSSNIYLSNFAFCEFLFFLKKRIKLDKKIVLKFGKDLLEDLPLNQLNSETYFYAYVLLVKYDFQMNDSIIIADAILNDCNILYSRDMQHNQLIDNKLRIINPFLIL